MAYAHNIVYFPWATHLVIKLLMIISGHQITIADPKHLSVLAVIQRGSSAKLPSWDIRGLHAGIFPTLIQSP